MRTARKQAVLTKALLSLLMALAGCRHKQQPIIPKQTQAPETHAPAVSVPPTPQLPTPPLPQVKLEQPEPEKKPPVRRRRRKQDAPPAAAVTDAAPAATPAQPAPPATTTDAPTATPGTAEPSAASPIGQLSTTGDVASQQQNRGATQKLIDSTEGGINGIKRRLSPEEQDTATQIRSFLTKARQALSANDLDGAHTLAVKASVLLDELTKH